MLAYQAVIAWLTMLVKVTGLPFRALQRLREYLLIMLGLLGVFAARVSGLAFGLALAVRPAGLAEVSGAQGWVLKIVSAKRLETIFGCP